MVDFIPDTLFLGLSEDDGSGSSGREGGQIINDSFAALFSAFTIDDVGNVRIQNCLSYDAQCNLSAAGEGEVYRRLDYDANGFISPRIDDIRYVTGPIGLGQILSVNVLNIDNTASGDGNIIGFAVSSTQTGLSTQFGFGVGPGVNPFIQQAGTPINMDSALVAGVDERADLIANGTDVPMFVLDNDTVIIGHATKFQDIMTALSTVASGAGIVPTFEFSTGVGTWDTFFPVDTTDGFRQNGNIIWADILIPSWAIGTGGEYLIRITRTQNGLGTTPISSFMQIEQAALYSWSSTGNLVVRRVHAEYGGLPIPFYLPDLLGDGSLLTQYVAAGNQSFPADMATSQAFLTTAPSGGDITVTIEKNTVQVGSVTFLNGAQVGVFNTSNAFIAEAGDVFTISNPVTGPFSAAGLSITIVTEQDSN